MLPKHDWYRSALVIALTAALLTGGAQAQEFSFWGGLEPGPYGVGFETIEQYDYSRTFRSPTDYFGQRQEGETARPIQVCIWYPAQVSAAQTPMVYAEYAFPFPADNDFFDLATAMQNRELQTLGFFMGGDRVAMAATMDIPMVAVRDADWAEGPFPLIVYHAGFRGGYSQNVVMCEYLASHGFVVITTHPLGTSTNNPQTNPRDLETNVRDKEFAVGLMRGRSHIDHSKLGVLGAAAGALGGLIHQMRNPGVTALAFLQADFELDGANDSSAAPNPSFDHGRVSVPLLHVNVGGEPGDNHALIDSLAYAERWVVTLNGPQATDLTAYGVASTQLPRDSTMPPVELTRRTYETSCAYVLDFFRAYLSDDEAALAWLNNSPSESGLDAQFAAVVHHEADDLPPTREQFIAVVREYGPDRAVELCEKFDLTNPEHPIVPDPTFTALGYGFLQRAQIAPALVIFKMGVDAYPTSANAWDSYGEACAANGDLQKAVECYKKALEILPSDEGIDPALRDAIGNNAPGIIERLEQRIAEQNANDG